ncbi:MAG: sigma-70 family RNA polymerase sigma factor [Planctomycetaceae bacterium]|nr:sigma-70 family RNA polymerase sigma factor [Planctomycetaceae bacterium]
MMDDDQLMIQVQQGDPAALGGLVERYQGPLIGFFVRNTHDRHLAEDLAQETLLKIFDQSWNYLPRGRFRAWMYRIARNLMIDHHRRQSRDALLNSVRSQADDGDDALVRLAAEMLSPLELAGIRETARLIDQALAEIPEEQRTTFTLHHYAGLPLAEVAEVTETSLATCKSRLRLAREKLSEFLRRKGFDPPGAVTSGT